ncbi:MAG: trigger factor [Micromonosporaceae bacterium]|nr:trigger factor [Micromonosporaceae bacterium]
MESTVETLSPTRVRLAIEVPFAELEPSLKQAYKEIGAQVTIPGFRKGKVPPVVLDQRIGRERILSEAVQGAIPGQLLAAVRQNDLRTIGRPSVEITEFGDGQPLKFTAEVDVRPEITLPELDGFEVTVDTMTVTDEAIDEQLEALRARFGTLKGVDRPAQRGDFVQLDLAASVDGQEVPGGTATNLSHEVGSNQLLPGLDETVEGMSAGESATFTSTLVAGEFAGREAEVSVTVRTVRERELPPLDDDFAQLASEFDTLEELRADIATRLGRVLRRQQLVQARDRALQALVEAADIPVPEGVLSDEVQARRQALVDRLERAGLSLDEFLASDNKTEEDLTADLTEAASRAIRNQLFLDAVADAEEFSVSDEEFTAEVVHRAQHAGMQPQQYYDQLVKAGLTASIAVEVRRNKALLSVLERITIKDGDGTVFTLNELRGGVDPSEDHFGHNHD